jgi:pre-mRNA-splicing factor RBM22/SLT11
MLDVDIGLPVQVRDKAMNIHEEILPMTQVGKEYSLNMMKEEKYTNHGLNDLLLKLARTSPYYKRNRARLCSFNAKGCCNRGIECPYRHDQASSTELSKQNYHARYYGTHDPVADKMLARVEKKVALKSPLDTTITTIFVGNLTPIISVEDLQDVFKIFGNLDSIKVFYTSGSGIVTYCSRHAAEKAVTNLGTKLLIKGKVLTIKWGKFKRREDSEENKRSNTHNAIDTSQFGSSL